MNRQIEGMGTSDELAEEYDRYANESFALADEYRAEMAAWDLAIANARRKKAQAQDNYERALERALEWQSLSVDLLCERSRVVLRVIQGGKCA